MGARARGALGVWLAIELTTFGFIGIIRASKRSEESECIKYFLVQRVSSSLLFGAIVVKRAHFSLGVDAVVIVALLTKLGLVPFHW